MNQVVMELTKKIDIMREWTVGIVKSCGGLTASSSFGEVGWESKHILLRSCQTASCFREDHDTVLLGNEERDVRGEYGLKISL